MARLLYFSVGVTTHLKASGGDIYLRANPSAGGLYPTETYVVIKNYQEIRDGLYAYHPLYMELYSIRQGNVWESSFHALLEHPSIPSSKYCTFFFWNIFSQCMALQGACLPTYVIRRRSCLGECTRTCPLLGPRSHTHWGIYRR